MGPVDYTDEQKEDFKRLREGPTGRASIFAPELLLVKARKRREDKKKTQTRPVVDLLREAISKVFENLADQGEINQILNYARSLRHADDLDPNILVIATRLILQAPQEDPRLRPEVLARYDVNQWAEIVIRMNKKEATPDRLNKVKLDIVSYYQMFFMDTTYDD
jgi:hypothetical protein